MFLVMNMCTKELKDNPKGFRSPRDIHLPYKELWIKTKDNLKLYGWFLHKIQPEKSDFQNEEHYQNYLLSELRPPTFIYFHENAGNIGFRLPFAEILYKKLNANVLVVGYRGYGYSEGVPTEEGLMIDAEAIIEYVFNKENTEISNYIDKSNVYIFGRSLGGAVSIYVSERLKPNIKGIILENTFSSMGDMVDHLFPIVKNVKFFLLKNKWPTKDRIKNISYPILFMMSEKDELVPYLHMEELYNTAKHAIFKQKHIILNGTHNNSWQMDINTYLSQIQLFMERCNKLSDYTEDIEIREPLSINDMINREEEFKLIDKKFE
jgi:fermentation-respiration switch protein FrsA (DUF1100 family)